MAPERMEFDWQLEDLDQWWSKRPFLKDAFSPTALRDAILHLMTGGNYRTITERAVREKLHVYHSWLMQVVQKARKEFGQEWPAKLLGKLFEKKDTDESLRNLEVWLLGLTHKTAVNLGLLRKDEDEIKSFLKEAIKMCNEVSSNVQWDTGTVTVDLRNNSTGETESLDLLESLWLMQMVGASTLTVRGSNKAIYGKRFERAFLRVALEMLGLKKDSNFWLNIERDAEVEREVDGEVETKRGRIRIDIGLIGVGNQEVSEDKLNRVGNNGIVIVDKLGSRSNVGVTAERKGVKLIQIRHNFPLTEMYEHLKSLVKVKLKKPPETKEGLKENLLKLPDETFKSVV
ncbi:MAG: CfrBI family restriction endonuclease [Thermodesulfobacteriota bacterium]